MKKVLFTILGVLLLDQCIKFWIKLTFNYGESQTLIPGVFELQFVENPGMAFGWVLPGATGKLVLSIFRIIVVTAIGLYVAKMARKNAHPGYLICVALIIAGALGNIIDSAVYGLLFDQGVSYLTNEGYYGIATISGQGYAPFLMGNVVDMFHLSLKIGSWEVFPPVFNVADFAITTGIISIIVWNRKFFPKPHPVAAEAEPLAVSQHDEPPIGPVN